MKPYDIIRNNDSWTKDYNILFVDQPVGTGLSYADESIKDVFCTNMSCVADDFYVALKELFQNPTACLNQLKFKTDHPFIIFG
jgi:carboxypeptidase C (cathepsin A)